MSTTYYLNIALTYIIIGFGTALLFYYGLRKPVLGRFWGALLIGLIGSFLGGVIEFFLADIIQMLTNLNNVNIFPPVFTAALLIWILSRISSATD